MCFFAETRSDVPAHGCVLSAAGNPVQRQIPVVPQTHCWICFVNAAVVSSFDYLCRRCSPLWFLITSGPVLTSVWVSVCVCSLRTRGGFLALSPISPQEMFLQPPSHSREKEEAIEDDYRTPYHPYHLPRHLHPHHLHTLVTTRLEKHLYSNNSDSVLLFVVGAGARCRGVQPGTTANQAGPNGC